MSAILTRIVQILGALKVPQEKMELHDKVVRAVTDDEKGYGLIYGCTTLPRINDLLAVYDQEPFHTQYWVAVFEALIIAHLADAHTTLKGIEEYLHLGRHTGRNNIYPAVLTGILQAAAWLDSRKDKPSNALLDRELPATLGRMLRDYATADRGDDRLQPSDAAIDMFSSAFSNFLRPEFAGEFWHRVTGLLETLRETNCCHKAANKLMVEVIIRIGQQMSLPAHIEMLADTFGKQNLAQHPEILGAAQKLHHVLNLDDNEVGSRMHILRLLNDFNLKAHGDAAHAEAVLRGIAKQMLDNGLATHTELGDALEGIGGLCAIKSKASA